MVSRGTINLDRRMRDALMPMYLRVAANGRISDIGPTLRKMRNEAQILNCRFLEVFEVVRPLRGVQSVSELAKSGDGPVELRFRDAPRTRLTGVMLLVPDELELFFNLSFGISAFAAIEDYHLTNSDFAPTDATLEMLYLKEANTAVTNALFKQSADLEESRARAREQATTDSLTKLGNRRLLGTKLGGLIARGEPFAFLQVDLDGFKAVNDRLGHAAGDAVLEIVAKRLRHSARQQDMLFRIGGDEFVMLLPGLDDPDEIEDLGRRMIERLEEKIDTEKGQCRISGTIGYTRSSDYTRPEPDQMANDADAALYEGKRAGKGVVMRFVQSGALA